MEDRTKKALDLSESILEDIDTEKISISSVALRCMRLARMMNDADAIKWLEFEISGYPKVASNTLEREAFAIACARGRRIVNDDPADKRVFSDLADEMEAVISAKHVALQSLKSEGVSVSGEWAFRAMTSFTSAITNNINNLTQNIKENKKRLSVLRGNYYRYVLSVNYELKFSGRVEEIFRQYRANIDNQFISIVPDSLRKLDAVYNNLTSDNPESWSQCLTTCRRFFEDVSNALFETSFPDFKDEKYKTKSGKELSVTGDKYINRLYCVLDIILAKQPENTIVGSHVMHIIDWIDKLHDTLCKGVHADISFEEASRAVIHTYTCLGDLCTLRE